MIDHLKSTLTASGCSLVIYESDQLANITADQSHADDIIGLIVEPNSMTLNTDGNGVTKQFPATTVEIMKMVRPEDAAENNRATLESLAEIARYFAFGLINSGLYHKIPTITANKITENKYDANVIGWSLSIQLRPLANQNNCVITFPADSTVEPINFVRLTADELAAIRGANLPNAANVFATMDDLPSIPENELTGDELDAIQQSNDPSLYNVFATMNDIPDNELTPDELAAINGANDPSASNVFATMDDLPLNELSGDQLDGIQYAHSPSLYNPFATLNDTPVIPNATESAAGIAEIATQTETNTGTDDQRIVTPLKQKTYVAAAIVAIYNTESVSRTIYVATTGNDTTGDGSVGLPFLTINKALTTIKKILNTGITITIQLGAGTFDIAESEFAIIGTLTGSGGLTIQGTLALANSGFTLGAADATDLLKYGVSGGTTASWTTDQWKFYFAKSGANYYPITHNTTTTISICLGGASGITEIYQLQTILNVTATTNSIIKMFIDFTYQNIEMIPVNSNNKYNLPTSTIYFTECYFHATAQKNIWCQKCYGSAMNRCSSNFVSWIFPDNIFSVVHTNNFFYAPASSATGLMQVGADKLSIRDDTFENTGTSLNSYCIRGYQKGGFTAGTNNNYIKFINSKIAFQYGSTCDIDFTQATTYIILINVTYFARKFTGVSDYDPNRFKINYANLKGSLITRWFYDTIYEFVNVVTGRLLSIPTIIYPEIDPGLSAALPNNATTNVVIGNKLQNRSIVIEYQITRGTTHEMNRLQIIHNGTTLTLFEPTPVGDDVGVSFAVAFSTNDIQLQCTMTNTGTAATMKYNASRVIITPLTI
jgi:hypothetical protein